MKTPCCPDDERREALAFAHLPGVGCVAFREAVERHGSASEAFHRSRKDTDKRAALHSADAVLATADSRGIQVLLFGDPEYPECLRDLTDPPSVLYALGKRELLERRRVGIVGTRHASPAGERVAHRMAALLADAGAVVVSGMAFGIDAAAHRGALDAGGGTIAVLGSGVDRPYPPAHRALHARIAEVGLVLSEAPIGSHPTLGAFPRRNRIIAALSETLVVIEAGARSGALITARQALELGRTVGAVPGPIDSPRHVGSNWLLSEGASFLASVTDVLSTSGLPHSPPTTDKRDSPHQATVAIPVHQEIINAVRAGASDVDDLARSVSLSARDLAVALADLELSGRVVVGDRGDVSLAGGA
ncbi:MAG TPA: DNA-processing protein DprA [Gemmatimonadaceae bacterium]